MHGARDGHRGRAGYGPAAPCVGERRAHLVRQRTRIKNQVHAILARNLAPTPPVSDLFGKTGRHWLSRQELPVDERATVQQTIEAVRRRVARALAAAESCIAGALGAALFAWHQILNKERKTDDVNDSQRGSYLGPEYRNNEIRAYLETQKIAFTELTDDELPGKIAELINAQKVIGWFYGRMEFGPRALGQRSILLNPADRERTAYHESGHALVGMLTEGADPVRKISIIPRGMALGVTLSTVVFFLYFEIRMLPPKPREWPLWKKLGIYLEYFAYPMVGLVMSVLPAFEAHTRLLFGHYLEYRVTEKV